MLAQFQSLTLRNRDKLITKLIFEGYLTTITRAKVTGIYKITNTEASEFFLARMGGLSTKLVCDLYKVQDNKSMK